MSFDFHQLPHDSDMELELLGSLLLKEGLIIPKISAILQPDDFFVSVHKIIYKTILDLHRQGIVPDMLLIYNELQKLRDFEPNQKLFLETVTSLGEVAFTTAYSIHHANLIKEKSARRKLISLANKILHDSQDPTVEFTQLLSNSDSAFRSISDTSTPNNLIRHHDYYSQFLMSDISTNKIYAERKTGFDNIDQFQIFSPGLYVIGATPAAGKTTFFWQLLDQLAKRGETCI